MLVTSLVSDYLNKTTNNNNNNTMVQSVDVPIFYHNRISSMADELLSLKWNNHKSTFADVLSVLRDQEVFVDVTLACGGKLYPAHKFVLSTCSEYFREMFTKTPCKHPIVFLKDVPGRDLEALLDFMYRGEVNVPQTHLTSLIRTAEGLQVKGLAVPDEHHLNPTASYVRRARELSATRPPPAPSVSPPPKRKRHHNHPPKEDSAYTPVGALSMMYANVSPHEPPNSPYDLSQKSSSSSVSQSDATPGDRPHSVSPEHHHHPHPSSSAPPTAPSFSHKDGSSSDEGRAPSRTPDDAPPHRRSRSPPPPSSTPQPPRPSSTPGGEPPNGRDSVKEESDPLPGPSGVHGKGSDPGTEDDAEETIIKEDTTIDFEEDENEFITGTSGGGSDGGDTTNGGDSLYPECLPHHYSEASNSSLPTLDPALARPIPSAKAHNLHHNHQPHHDSIITSTSSALLYDLTSSSQSPTDHLFTLGSGIDPTNCLQCPLCLKEFKVLGSLKRHYRSHINFKPFVCEICQKRFTLNQYLVEHRRTHTGERPYTCHVCQKCFAQTGTLHHHIKNVHQKCWTTSDRPDRPTDKN